MRFHIGPPPQNPDFQPELSGWTALREPRPILLNLYGLPFSLVAAIVLSAAWGQGSSVSFEIAPATAGPSVLLLYLLLVLLVGFPAIIAVHELIHGFGYPNLGFSRNTILAVWPSRLLFYAGYLGPMSRNRWLGVYLMPFLVLSVMPVAVCKTTGAYSGVAHLVSVFNGLLSGGDLFCVLLIWFQVPRTAILQNQGWSTWWKIEPSSGQMDRQSADKG